MILKLWENLPHDMKNDCVKKYYCRLYEKRHYLYAKRIFDIAAAITILIITFPILIILGIAIKLDSKGPCIFSQIRVTQYGKKFKIYKLRTMSYADTGPLLTAMNDIRITNIGKFLRRYRLDEIPQLINIILGDMSFVGTRPEVVKFVEKYSEEMKATLLLPAGVTSIASILYKDEEVMLKDSADAEEIYLNEVLPEKMMYNLRSIEDFSLLTDIKTIFWTVSAMVKKDTVLKRVTNNYKDLEF
jgi:lipopolysaccharide/colanic/teichoic acid biosynthesis glycosyltransferase